MHDVDRRGGEGGVTRGDANCWDRSVTAHVIGVGDGCFLSSASKGDDFLSGAGGDIPSTGHVNEVFGQRGRIGS